jgi:hypothetical protein
MSKPLSQEELEELCDYCRYPREARGVNNYGNGPVFCADSGLCDEAYERYLDEYEEE